MYGRRVSKTDPRVEAYGSVDELNAVLGLARALTQERFVAEQILAAQKELIIVMGQLATAPEDLERYLKDGFQLTTDAMAERVTGVITELEKDKTLYPKDWVVPGSAPDSAALDVARTVCRRAERLLAGSAAPREVFRYLNRLSDLCWILARYLE